MRDIRNVIIIVLVIIVWLQRSCTTTTNKLIFNPNRIDTITQIDTVWTKDTIRQISYIRLPQANDSVRVDTFTKTIRDFSICNYLRIYKDSVADSNLTIYWLDTVQGRLISQDLRYKLKIPYKINTTKTIVKSNKFSIFVGLELGGNKEQFNTSPFISINTKRNQYSFRYDLMNKTYNIGLGIKLFNK